LTSGSALFTQGSGRRDLSIYITFKSIKKTFELTLFYAASTVIRISPSPAQFPQVREAVPMISNQKGAEPPIFQITGNIWSL
jgi:hypothetical protein